MNDTLKKLNEETKQSLIASISSKMFAELLVVTKSASDADAGSFRVVVSTNDVDRQGESVDQKGWDLTFYKSNPIVLWGHDYGSLPIGVCTSIEVKDGKLTAEGKFAPADANPFAQQVRKLYDLGMVNTTSAGFIPKEYSTKSDGVILKSELLEFSFVPVPANPFALRLNQVKEFNLDTTMLKTKGLEFTVKEDTTEATPAAEVPPADPTPAPTPAPAPVEEKEKGAIADKLEQMAEMKYIKCRAVFDAMDAFYSCFFCEDTPTEDFGTLLAEVGDILKMIASSDGSEVVENSIKEKTAKLLNGKKSVTAEVKSSLQTLIKHSHVALGGLVQAEGNKGGKRDIATENKGRIDSKAFNEATDFVETRQLLRVIDNSVETILRNFNRSAKKYESTK